MENKIKAININNTWTLTELPRDRHAIGSKWIYKIKGDDKGCINRYKFRIVAKDYSQIENIDYFDTFTPVSKISSIHFLLALATIKDWHIHQMDVVTTFLHGDFEEVYMRQPKGFEKDNDMVCHLHKALYGLKQASRTWYQKIDYFLLKENFTRTESDHSVYKKICDNCLLIVAIYVDDLIIICGNLKVILDFKH